VKYEFHFAAQDEHLGNVSYYESIRAGLGAQYLGDFDLRLSGFAPHPAAFV